MHSGRPLLVRHQEEGTSLSNSITYLQQENQLKANRQNI
jgi:hypothetical protein